MVVISKKKAAAPDYIYTFLVVAFLLFAIRDGLTGSIRYFLTLLHLDILWFIPDGMSLLIFVFFVYHQIFVKKNIFGIYFIMMFFFSLVVSIFFMNKTMFSLFSSIKMFIPMVVGFAFYERSVTEWRVVRIVLIIIFVSSVIGLILNPYFDYPWVGQEINSFGLERQATKLWWQEGGVRYGGLAGDSTMAAYMTIFTYVLVSFHMKFRWNVICWPFIVWAIMVSTSKTALGLIFIYIFLFLAASVLKNGARTIKFYRINAYVSYVIILLPVVLMISLTGSDLGSLSSNLMSLSDRIDNTWPAPFLIMADIFPIGLIFGCGIGCFSYPMEYTDLAYLIVPVDNFYMSTLVQMGIPFVFFVAIQIYCIRFFRNPVKLALVTLINIYTITIQCYGPSYATLMIGYAFSEMFAFSWREKGRDTLWPLQSRLPRGATPLASA